MTLSKWLFHYLLLWDGNHTIHCTNFSLTKDFSSTKSSWISLEVWPVVCYSMYKVDFIVDFICILRIIWWSKSSRVERGIYLTFTICPNPQFFFSQYYLLLIHQQWQWFKLPTDHYWFIFFTRTIVNTLVISVVFLFIFPLNSFICSSIEVLLFFYYFFLYLFICVYSSNFGVYYHDFVFSVWFRYASP